MPPPTGSTESVGTSRHRLHCGSRQVSSRRFWRWCAAFDEAVANMPSAAMATYERRRQRLLSRRRFAVRGCRDPFLLPHRTPGTGWTYRRFGHLELFVSDPPGANDPLGTSLFLIQNDSGLSQGLAHYSAAGWGCGKLTGGKLGSPGEDPTKVT